MRLTGEAEDGGEGEEGIKEETEEKVERKHDAQDALSIDGR